MSWFKPGTEISAVQQKRMRRENRIMTAIFLPAVAIAFLVPIICAILDWHYHPWKFHQ